MTESRSGTCPWVVDAHAHLHSRFDLARALRAAADRAGPGRASVLLLVDTAGRSSLAHLATTRPPGWKFESLEEGLSCRASSRDHGPIYLVAGRQIVTAERLEVLALGSSEQIADRLSIGQTIDRVGERGALAVLPWGFGKWTGSRGRVIAGLVTESDPRRFFLGDNGGRAGSRRPEMFLHAEERGFRVLPGSDPLPLRDQERRVGAYGFELPAGDPEHPWESLRHQIEGLRRSPDPFGSRVSWPVFARQQTSMLLRKHVVGRLRP